MTQLILLPGLACNAAVWAHQLAALPGALQPVVTDVHTRFDSIPAMAQALRSEHTGTLILCGASMGGIVAMEVVRQAPERIQGLALLGTNARPETPEMRTLRSNAVSLFEQGRAHEVIGFNAPLAFHPSRATDKVLLQTYVDLVLDAGSTQLIAQNRALMVRPDARLHLPRISCPTLVLCGDTDQLTPPECSREIAALIPNAQLILLAQCGHMLTMEQPEAVNQALLGWLAGLDGF